MEKVVTIPKELAERGELVIIPRGEYEEYLRLKKVIPLVRADNNEKKAIREGRKEIKNGRYLTLKQLCNGLER